MTAKYKFHEWRNRVNKYPKTQLPEDINAPIEQFLEKIGCTPALKMLVDYRKKVRYGKIQVSKAANPDLTLTMSVNCGMIDLCRQEEVEIVDGWRIVTVKTKKNTNLDKHNEEE